MSGCFLSLRLNNLEYPAVVGVKQLPSVQRVSLVVDAVCSTVSYELGSGKVHEDGSGSGGSMGATGNAANAELEGEVGSVREDLVKIQEMLLLFSERLAQLEQGAAATTTASSLQHDVDETQLPKGPRGHTKRRRKDKT